MIYSLYVEGEITPDKVQELMDRLVLVESGSELNIYVTSVGGDLNATDILKHYLENNFKKVNIIIAGYIISSMWRFALTLKNRGFVHILGRAYAQDHNSIIYSETVYNNQSNYYNKIAVVREVADGDREDWYNLCKKEFGYTEEELKCHEEEREIYFNKERMIEIINNSENYLKRLST